MALTPGSLVSLSTLPLLIGLILGISVLYAVGTVLYNIYFHPLAKYPGPKLAAASRLWYCYHSVQGQLCFVVHDLHQRYGHVVRVAPDELAYTSSNAWNQIYGHRPGKNEVMKDPTFYANMSSSQKSIIDADRDRHGHLRKQMSHGFSERALREQEQDIRGYADLLISKLEEKSCNGTVPVDIVLWYNFFTFDVMGDLCFGKSFGCLESSAYHPWVKLLFDSVKVSMFVKCCKFWPSISSYLMPFIVPKDLARRRVEHRAMAKAKVEQRKAQKSERTDLMSGCLRPDSGVTAEELQGTCETLIVAGSETTATLLSGVTYLLLTHPEKMKKAMTEVRGTFETADQISFVAVNKLPYVLACLNEALRRYPPAPEGLPRNTTLYEEIICGESVPPQTKVRIYQYAINHSAANFHRPNDFMPERWLDDAPEEFENDNRSAMQPFSVGPRNCIGRNLAYVEMRLILTMVLWHFDLELMPESTNWINQKDFLLWEKPPMMVKLTPRAQ